MQIILPEIIRQVIKYKAAMKRESEFLIDEVDGEDWSKPEETDPHTYMIEGKRFKNSFRVPSNFCAIGEPLTPLSTQGHRRTIIHIDIDCFYAQVEMIHNPKLRDIPFGVRQKHCVVTCNYPARAHGVTKCMSVSEAQKKCPELVLVSGEDLTRYRHMSYKISDFLLKYTPKVERLGFDENYLDVTEMVEQRIQGSLARSDVVGHIFSPESGTSEAESCFCGCHQRLAVGSQIASEIRSVLFMEYGVTSCAGIAHNKVLAKLIGSQHKPNQQTTIFPLQTLQFLSNLGEAHHITGVGWSTQRRLKALGVVTVTDLQQFPLRQLQDILGISVGTTIHQLSYGIDDAPVVTFSRPQILSIEDSFQQCSTVIDVHIHVNELMNNLLDRVLEDGRTPQTLRLTVQKAKQEHEQYRQRVSRQCSLPTSIFKKLHIGQSDTIQARLVNIAMTLFHKLVDPKKHFNLRVINVAFAKLLEPVANPIDSFCSLAPSQHVVISDPKCLSTVTSLMSEPPHSQTHNDTAAREDLPYKNILQSTKTQTDTVRIAEIPFSGTEEMKSKHLNISNFFLNKKQKLTVDTKTDRSDETECNVSDHTEQCDMISVPPGIDVNVFVQLPQEIQREIIQNYKHEMSPIHTALPSQKASKHGKRIKPTDSLRCKPNGTETFSQLEENSQAFKKPVKMKKQLFIYSTEKGSSEQGTLVDHFFASPSETKFKHVLDCTLSTYAISKSETTGRSDKNLYCRDSFSNNSLGIYKSELCNSRLKTSMPTEIHVKGADSEINQYQHKNKKTIIPDSIDAFLMKLNTTQQFIPKGIAPDVFHALPAEIQREVAAEAALQKHGHTQEPDTKLLSIPNLQKKPGVRKSNSLLNYLKRK